ncbi:NlpC/P60 family protein [Paenibacillus filicis]|uniref:NlpC/P60 family protein n=1 Tax=Paenibacillus gyeongsangnamensis TaxID=3388067 RepID=A0ABT4Q731_9BACL|nr:NlpC/P60 family protein [Paenibacillus filicis]MCZ8512674.1 NlpC/P60 family protein [Paenibacillus filicis]
MIQLKRMIAAVSVATVWTKPESPRLMDEPALRHPADLRAWLAHMSVADKLDLCEANRVQTQILYGTLVLAEEERDGWVKVLIPEQATRKEARGYPGWVPRRQLMPEPEGWPATALQAKVASGRAWLYSAPSAPIPHLELSFLTVLPVLETGEEWVKVRTAEGSGFLRAADVRLTDDLSAPGPAPEGGVGQAIVKQGEAFLGLPYLWGGMSSFGYDCSGFAYSMHRAFGLSIPRDASDQARHGKPVEKDRLEPGDLLFFAHEEGKGAVHHVGIYAGNGRMLHSPESVKSIELIDLSGYRLAAEHCASRRYWE